MSNQAHHSDTGVWDPNSKIDMWDPSCIGTSNAQQHTNPASTDDGFSAPAQTSWYSQTSSLDTNYNMSSMRESLRYPNQQPPQAPVDRTYSDIYYQPSSQTSGYNSPQNPVQQLNVSGNNMHNPPQSYSRVQQPHANYPSSNFTAGPSQNWNTFVNPLNTNDNSESADVKVDRMKKAAEKAKEIETDIMRKPTTISKGALAAVQQDLTKAAAPFQSAETLKLYRDKQLGILSQETEDKAVTKSSEILEKSNLSATATEFVPRSFNVRVEVGVEGGEAVLIPKLNLPLSPDSERTESNNRSIQEISVSSTAERKQDSGQSWMSPFWLHVSEDSIIDPFETNIWQNPMDGPSLKPSPNKTKPLPRISTPVKMMSSARKYHVDKSTNDHKNKIPSLSDQFDNTIRSEELESLVLSSIPFSEINQMKHFLIPGLCTLNDLGFQSEQDSLARLKQKVKKAQTRPSIDEEDAVIRVTECINNLIIYPACFDSTVPSLLKSLKGYAMPDTTVEKIVDAIYETCVVEPNFRYLGAQLCDTLARSETGLPKFRSILLSKAQNEFKSMDDALKARGFTQFVAELFLSLMMERKSGVLERFAILGRAILGVIGNLIKYPVNDNIQCAVRVLKLTVVSMEDSLKDDGKGSIDKLENTLNDLISFLDDKKELSKTTCSLLSGLKTLRSQNWGRVPKDEAQSADWPSSSTKQYYPAKQGSPTEETFMTNEPVFFTPEGVQYTTADAADPEFYNKHLAKFDSYNPAEPQDEQFSVNPLDEAQYTMNPLSNTGYDLNFDPQGSGDYSGWSPADEDQFDSASAEDFYNNVDDYDAELEQFIKNMGGMAT